MSATSTTPPHRTAAVLVVLFGVLVALVIAPRPAAACDCPEPPPPSEAADEADAVFAGEVVETRLVGGEHDGDLIARIEVREVWRGEVAEVVEVRTQPDTAMCGYRFTKGRTDLFYANLGGDDILSTSLCSRNAPLERADEDLAALGEGSSPVEGSSPMGGGGDAVWPWAATAALGAAVLLFGVALSLWSRRLRTRRSAD